MRMIHRQPDGMRTEVLPRRCPKPKISGPVPRSSDICVACGPLSLPSKLHGRCLIRSARIGGFRGHARSCEQQPCFSSTPHKAAQLPCGTDAVAGTAGHTRRKMVPRKLDYNSQYPRLECLTVGGVGGCQAMAREQASGRRIKIEECIPSQVPTRPAWRRS